MSYRYKCQYHSRQAENHTDSLTVITLDELLVGRLIPEELERVKKLFQIIITDGIAGSTTFCKGNAAAVSFILMILQSVAAPLPAFLITFANASLFGWWKGAILSWSSAMAGAAVCFWIARILGRDVVERLTSKAGLEQIDEFFEKHGRLSILIARLLPFISFDIVSYAAGLTSMSFGGFLIATGIGQLPATIIYSYVGGMLTGGARLMVTGLMMLFALSGLIVLIRQIYIEKTKKQTADKEKNDGKTSCS